MKTLITTLILCMMALPIQAQQIIHDTTLLNTLENHPFRNNQYQQHTTLSLNYHSLFQEKVDLSASFPLFFFNSKDATDLKNLHRSGWRVGLQYAQGINDPTHSSVYVSKTRDILIHFGRSSSFLQKNEKNQTGLIGFFSMGLFRSVLLDSQDANVILGTTSPKEKDYLIFSFGASNNSQGAGIVAQKNKNSMLGTQLNIIWPLKNDNLFKIQASIKYLYPLSLNKLYLGSELLMLYHPQISSSKNLNSSVLSEEAQWSAQIKLPYIQYHYSKFLILQLSSQWKYFNGIKKQRFSSNPQLSFNCHWTL